MRIEPGTVVADRYRADRRIGAGGMGEVWFGEDLSDNSPVALKLLLAQRVGVSETVSRFYREARVLERVRSDYVASVLDFVTDPVVGLVLVMEFVPGQTLYSLLVKRNKLPVIDTLDIIADVLRGLGDLHAAKIVHRDMKPGNIVLRPLGGGRTRSTLIDFGVSRILSSPGEDEVTAITQADRVLGTLEYMAPEQILGSRNVTEIADLYAVGAIMFRCLVGHHVFEGLHEGKLAVAKLNKDAPKLKLADDSPAADELSQLVARLLSRKLAVRYKTAEEVLEAVVAVRERLAVSGFRPSIPPSSGASHVESTGSAEVTSTNSPNIEVTETSDSLSFLNASTLTADAEPASRSSVAEIRTLSTSAIEVIDDDSGFDDRVVLPVESPPAFGEGVPRSSNARRQEVLSLSSAVPETVAPPAQRSRRRRGNGLVAFALFVLGAAGGAWFGVSYVQHGVVFRVLRGTPPRFHAGRNDVPSASTRSTADSPAVQASVHVSPVDSVPEGNDRAEAGPDASSDAASVHDGGLPEVHVAASAPSTSSVPPPPPKSPVRKPHAKPASERKVSSHGAIAAVASGHPSNGKTSSKKEPAVPRSKDNEGTRESLTDDPF